MNKWRKAEDRLLGEHSDPKSLFICSIFEGERPLKGLPGALDWRLRGFLSRFVINGKITGKFGESVYIPILHLGSIRHLLVVGLGAKEKTLDAKSSQEVTKLIDSKASGMHFEELVLSESSFPFLSQNNDTGNSLKKKYRVEYTL